MHPVAKVRKIVGLTQEEFAEVIGVSRDLVAKIETGKAGVSATVARRIATEFGAKVPRGSASAAAKGQPRAIGRSGTMPPKQSLPLYAKSDYERWPRGAAMVVSVMGALEESSWLALMRAVGAVADLYGLTALQRFVVTIETAAPHGTNVEGLKQDLIAKLARTEGIELRKAPPESGQRLRSGIVVTAIGERKTSIEIDFRLVGGVIPREESSGAGWRRDERARAARWRRRRRSLQPDASVLRPREMSDELEHLVPQAEPEVERQRHLPLKGIT